ncbi:MAG: hypothetical protein HY271_19425 [Deltaproteobacteria bacterium]|nr:hypothetical protein [Deltaproteobacteria bacterium]
MGNPEINDPPRGRRALGTVLVIGGVGTILYWTAFFSSGMVQATREPCYLVFERAFPAADAWTAVAAILAGVGLWRRRPSAVLFGIAGGSGFVFLGLMDVLYNLEHGMYTLRTAEMANEIVINAFCLTVGPTAIAYAWRQRRVLDPR